MVVNNNGLNLIQTGALNTFDTFSYMAFGTSTTTPTINDITLGSEVVRRLLESSSKDTSNYVYNFTGRIAISEMNTDNISEVGIFDASSSGNMGIKNLYQTPITKTGDEEIITTVKVTITGVNS